MLKVWIELCFEEIGIIVIFYFSEREKFIYLYIVVRVLIYGIVLLLYKLYWLEYEKMVNVEIFDDFLIY